MAKGILMATEHIGPDEAFEILTRASQLENRKVRDIAGAIVATHTPATPADEGCIVTRASPEHGLQRFLDSPPAESAPVT